MVLFYAIMGTWKIMQVERCVLDLGVDVAWFV